MFAILKSKKGTSLVEAMLAILIFAIVMFGASFFFVFGRSRINLQGRYRVALQLATQKIEQLKAGNYDDIQEGQMEENLSLDDLSYIRRVQTEAQEGGLYKKVTVTVHWGPEGSEHNISLVTFISPK